MPIDCDWQKNRIQKILKNSLVMLHVSLISPQIVENPRRVLQGLKESKYLYFLALLEDYIKIKNINPSKPLTNHLLKIIGFCHEDIQLLDYFMDRLNNLENEEKSLVDVFQMHLMATERRLKKSVVSKLNKEKNIHELSQQNEKIKRGIKVLQDVLKRQSLCSKWKQVAEEVLIKNFEKDLAYCIYENNLRIKQEIVLSNCSIRQMHASSVVKQNGLKHKLQESRKMYANLLRENLKQEKSARNERNNLLLQYESLLNHFDQTIGDKTKERMDLQEEYENQKKYFDSFLKAFYRQEAKYEQIVHAKKEEEKYQHEQKILLFMMNRSARVIQKHWRKFRRAQKKAAKRNKGRGKSKKK